MDEIISSRVEDTYCFLYSPCMPFSSNGVCCAHIYLILEKPRALSCPIKYLFPFQFHFPRFIRIWQMIVTFAVILSREKRKISIPLQISHHPFTPRNFNRFRSKIFSNPIWISGKSTRSKNCNKYLPPLIPSINCRFISNPPFSLHSQINNKFVAIAIFGKINTSPGLFVRTMEEMLFSQSRRAYIHERV